MFHRIRLINTKMKEKIADDAEEQTTWQSTAMLAPRSMATNFQHHLQQLRLRPPNPINDHDHRAFNQKTQQRSTKQLRPQILRIRNQPRHLPSTNHGARKTAIRKGKIRRIFTKANLTGRGRPGYMRRNLRSKEIGTGGFGARQYSCI